MNKEKRNVPFLWPSDMKMSKAVKDLTGQVFSRLTVKEFAGIDKSGGARWLCKCSCSGKQMIVGGHSLQRGNTRSCGCLRIKNKIGIRYGRLVVKEFAKQDQNGRALWLCKCDCKKEIIVPGGRLQSGHVKSCGCFQHEIKNRIGVRYGKLIVIKCNGCDIHNKILWKCKCDCGKEVIVRGNHLQSEGTRSCGCLQKETASKIMSEQTGKKAYGYVHGKYCGQNIKEILDLKEEVRKRDNHTCQECRKPQEQELKETGRILSVHHIDGDDTNNVKENMITYCDSCHIKLHRKELITVL